MYSVSQLSPCGHPVITDTSGVRGLAENDSRYYAIMDTFVVTTNNFIVLTLDKADILNFSYHYIYFMY